MQRTITEVAVGVAAALAAIVMIALPTLFRGEAGGGRVELGLILVAYALVGVAAAAFHQRVGRVAAGIVAAAMLAAIVVHPALPFFGRPTWVPDMLARVDPAVAAVVAGVAGHRLRR
ncbi:MAG: hypothetical protein KY462_14855 [Actinobacteria bacterium]|nr:hypothetical protein [Actinomycetota bacterium]